MKDLASFLLILMKPANESRIRAGDWPSVRENLQLILRGNPEATPLNGYVNSPGADGYGLPQIQTSLRREVLSFEHHKTVPDLSRRGELALASVNDVSRILDTPITRL